MKKIVVLTFDDGRKDQFTNAVRLLKQYNLTCSIYVTTGFIDGTLQGKSLFPSSGGKAMSVDDITTCLKEGFEIGIHSDKHTNDVDDINKAIEKLSNWCSSYIKDNHKWGFASPSSDIYSKNIEQIKEVSPALLYVRTGTQVRRNGLIYIFLFLINKICKSKKIFYLLNRNCLIEKKLLNKVPAIESIAIRSDTPVSAITYLLEKMGKNQVCVLLFHSILKNNQQNQKTDCWYYDYDKFQTICNYLVENNYKVLCLKDAIDFCKE